LSLLPGEIHSSWNNFLTSDILALLDSIEKFLGDTDYNPGKERVLRFLHTDLEALKIVILGQDPYPEKGVAVGRAFEVGGLKSWNEPFRQVSLKNIMRLIYKTQKGIEVYAEIPVFSQIAKEIKLGEFIIDDPPALFEHLEEQGVLFLNTCLTVFPGRPLSHQMIWQPFTEKLLDFISRQKPELFWFLWGKNAQSFKPFIYKGIFYECRHPMMCSSKYADDFLKSQCFKNTMGIVNWTGKCK